MKLGRSATLVASVVILTGAVAGVARSNPDGVPEPSPSPSPSSSPSLEIYPVPSPSETPSPESIRADNPPSEASPAPTKEISEAEADGESGDHEKDTGNGCDGLATAIAGHQMKVAENPDNPGLQNSLGQLQENYAKHGCTEGISPTNEGDQGSDEGDQGSG